MSYQASKTLPYVVELYRQLKRKRTAFAYGFVVSLPILVAIAVKFGPSGNSGGPTRLGSGSTDLIGLATIGAANFTVTMLYFATPFLLVTVIALFNGDTVASEASWSTLRYLLAAPVPRTRLLLQKIKVSLTLSAIAVLLMPLSAWIVGLIAFGSAPLQTPLGATFSNSIALSRVAIITAYLAISLLFVAGLAFYLSVRTDAPLGAVGLIFWMRSLHLERFAIGSRCITPLLGLMRYQPPLIGRPWFAEALIVQLPELFCMHSRLLALRIKM
jgi:ABC-2 type transport system permease protein